MISFDARRPLGTITRIAVTLVILLAPFSAPAQTAGAPPVCAQPVLPDGESSPLTMDRRVGKVLNRAIRKINAVEYTDARATVGELELDRLTPYELAMAEGVLFRIANAEQKYDEARQHVVNAIESCGLTDQGIANAQGVIMTIDARLGESRLLADWAESPCVKPEPNAIAGEGPSEPSSEEKAAGVSISICVCRGLRAMQGRQVQTRRERECVAGGAFAAGYGEDCRH